MRNRYARTAMMTLLAGALAMAPIIAGAKDDKEEQRKKVKQAVQILSDAEKVIEASTSAPDKGIPKEMLERAECVGVFPGLKKGAFIVGGEFGRGVFTCRKGDGTMGAPAFFAMGGPSVGWQFGGEEADVVLLVMNSQGIDHLLKSKFTLGGEASVSAGPVGRTAQAGTDLQMHAQILSWSRSRGLFVGVAVEGSVVRQSEDTNDAFYGRDVTAKDLLTGHAISPPSSARAFLRTVDEHTHRES